MIVVKDRIGLDKDLIRCQDPEILFLIYLKKFYLNLSSQKLNLVQEEVSEVASIVAPLSCYFS